jgi:hypothetical protein
MRLHALSLTVSLIATALPLSARAGPVQPDHEATTSAQKATSAPYTCPPGYYWETAGYAPHSKFRPAHCAVRW